MPSITALLLTAMVAYTAWVFMSVARPGRVRILYRHHFRDIRRERLFLASVGFFFTFAVTRAISYTQHAGVGIPVITIGTIHVHHLVWGILILLLVGYGSLVRPEPAVTRGDRYVRRLMAYFFGVGAALTLDEFALWLRLEDVYWAREGRQSLDAVLLFGALVSVGLWGGPFLRNLTRHTVRAINHAARMHGFLKRRRRRRRRRRRNANAPA